MLSPVEFERQRKTITEGVYKTSGYSLSPRFLCEARAFRVRSGVSTKRKRVEYKAPVAPLSLAFFFKRYKKIRHINIAKTRQKELRNFLLSGQ